MSLMTITIVFRRFWNLNFELTDGYDRFPASGGSWKYSSLTIAIVFRSLQELNFELTDDYDRFLAPAGAKF